jgi:hypothetical protein
MKRQHMKNRSFITLILVLSWGYCCAQLDQQQKSPKEAPSNSYPAAPSSQPNNRIKLVSGTGMQVRINIGGYRNNPEFTAQVVNNVFGENQQILIAAGAPVLASYKYDKPRGLGKGGAFSASFLSVQATDGSTVNLSGNYAKQGDDRTVAAGVLAGVLFFVPPIGAFSLFFLCLKGKPAVFGGEVITTQAFTAGEYWIRTR